MASDMRADTFGYVAVLTVAIHGRKLHDHRGVVVVEEADTTAASYVHLDSDTAATWPSGFKSYVEEMISTDCDTNYFIVQRTSSSMHVFKHEKSAAADFVAEHIQSIQGIMEQD